MRPEYKEKFDKLIEQYKPILLSPMGSHLLGYADKDSDEDYIGVFIEPIEDVVGFSQNDTVVFRSATLREAKHDAESIAGDVDLTLYGLRKFLRLAMTGNPNLLLPLFNPGAIKTEIGSELIGLRSGIIHKGSLNAVIGYAQSQLNRADQRMEKSNVPLHHDKRNVKNYQQAMLLSEMAFNLAEGAFIYVPISGYAMRRLQYIKDGDYGPGDVRGRVNENIQSVNENLPTSPLIDKPDYKSIENWMLSVYKKAWNG